MTDTCEMWCTTCGARMSKEETEGVAGCPKCKATGIPCGPEQDFVLEVNWHELRILGIWASNWAQKECDKGSQQTLRGILRRLEQQAPGESPLSLGGEIRQLRQRPDVGTIETNIPSEGLVEVYGPGAVGYATKPKGGML